MLHLSFNIKLPVAMTEKSDTVDSPQGPQGPRKDIIVTTETNEKWEVGMVTPNPLQENGDKRNKQDEQDELGAGEDGDESTEEPLNPVRKAAIQVVEAKWFDTLIIGLIALNCVFLALEDPTKTGDEKGYFQAEVLPAVEIAFAILFTIELILRCVAHGVPQYLDSGWNRMDATIVIISWFSIFGDWLGNLSSLRALRVLRALRMVTQFEGLKLLIETLFQVQLPAVQSSSAVQGSSCQQFSQSVSQCTSCPNQLSRCICCHPHPSVSQDSSHSTPIALLTPPAAHCRSKSAAPHAEQFSVRV